MTSIAIVGIGCRFPGADDAEAFWQNIVAGRDSFSEVPRDRWDNDVFYSKNGRDVDKTWTTRGAFIADVQSFAPLHYGIAPRRLEVMDPQHRLLIESTRVAIQDAGYEVRDFDRRRTGVYVGLSVSEYKELMLARVRAMQIATGDFGPALGSSELRALLLEATRNVAPTRAFSLAGALSNMGAASVSQTFDFTGPSYTIDAACASASVAVYNAVMSLRARAIDVAIAGGAYLNLVPDNLVAFTRVGAISPSGTCRPFDARADGFVQGDGIGMLFLKRIEDALRDGDRVYAIIRGAGCNNDGRGEGPMTPRVEGQLEVLRAAYADAGCSPASVRFFEAHGTGTSVGDPVEIEALGRLLSDAGVTREDAPFVGSVKSNVGHTMSAAGIAGLIKAVKVVEHRTAPPQAGFQSPHPELQIDRWPLRISDAARTLEGPALRVAASSFGFGGTNAHFVLEEPPAPRTRKRVESFPEAVLVTAPNTALLAEHLDALALAVDGLSLERVAHTLNACRKYERIRAVVVARTSGELAARFREAAAALRGAVARQVASFPLAVSAEISIYDSGDGMDPSLARPKVAFLFPGQGAQRVGLCASIRRRFPIFDQSLERFEDACAGVLAEPLRAYLYPAAAGEAADRALTATEVCQPVMAALGLALSETLAAAGVTADVSLGHSLGEFSAAANGGLLDPKEAVRLVALRGRAMRALDLPDTGAMAAVMADARIVSGALAGIDGVVVANFNRPGQVTISGTTAGVRAASEGLRARGLDVKALDVSHAFHSPLLEGIRSEMQSLLASVTISAPRHTVASCIADRPYEADPKLLQAVLLDHATAPVQFIRGLEQVRASGARVFVQIGAGNALLGFARATLGKDDATFLSLAPAADDGGLEFVRTVATLAAIGLPVRFAGLYGDPPEVVTLPETPLERQRFWIIRSEAQPLPRLDHVEPKPRNDFGLIQLQQENPSAMPASRVDDDLVALFAKQAEILRSHAEILAEQNRILGGRGTLPVELPEAAPARSVQERVASIVTEPAPPPEPRPTLPPPAERPTVAPASGVYERVLEMVAKVSAFPKDSLRPDQKLVEELGFDSLMVADLGRGIEAVYPDLGGLPQTLFGARTTVLDIAGHIERTLSAPRAPSPAPELAPLSIYRVEPRERALPDLGAYDPAGETWLVTDGGGDLTSRVGAELAARGATVHTTAAPGAEYAGLIHLAGLEVKDNGVPADPIAAIHSLAARLRPRRIAVITGLGGALGFDGSDTHRKNVAQAALLGFTKALARERADDAIRAIDVDPAVSADLNAAAIVREILSADREPEVGWAGSRRVVPELVEEKLPAAVGSAAASGGGALSSPILIAGGAGEIGSLVARDLASAGARHIALLGRRAADEKVAALLADLRKLGATAAYEACDASDAAALASAVARLPFGPIATAIHAAGAIDDAPVERLTGDRIDRVMRSKTGALQALRRAFPDLKTILVFSSWAGRFGNAGQTAYAAANDLADHLALAEPAASAVRVLSIDWPPWSSTAMVRSIPETIRNAMKGEGVTFAGDAEGSALARALLASDRRGVVVVGRDLPARRPRIVHDEVLSLERHPYLGDHRLRAAPVLPLASAADLLASAARAVLGTGAFSLEDLALVRGIEVEHPVQVRLRADTGPRGEARLELLTCTDNRWTPAYRATARATSADAPTVVVRGDAEALPFDVATFYSRHTFHGPRLQGVASIAKMTSEGIEGVVRPSAIHDWMPRTGRTSWTLDPLLLDSSFQLAGYWAYAHHQRAGFPTGFARLTLVRPFGDRPIRAIVRLDEASGDRFVGSIRYEDESGRLHATIERLEGRLAEVEAKAAPDRGTANGNGHAEAKTNGAAAAPAETWDIAQFPEVESLDQRLEMAKLIGLENPYFRVHEGTARNRSVIEGVEMLNYSSYNYLGFSGHPEVVAAAQEAIARYGTSVSASRVASGERPLHRQLESGIASHLGVDDAIVFVSGHATNVTTVGHLLGKDDLIIHDALIHDSIMGGIRLSGAARRPFPHGDTGALDRMLAQLRGHYRRALICAEGIYSMDGDLCDLPRLIEIKERHRCLLMIDEAHSIGVLGPSGRGVGHHFPGVDPRDVDIWMGTLSKSFASCGGYIAGSSPLVRYLKYTAPGFVYSAGITPPNAAAALKSLELMQRHPEIVERLRTRSKLFLDLARARGVNTGLAAGAAVIPAIVGNSLDCMRLSAALAKRRINVQPIVYPAVEDDSARLRFFLSATHTEEELRETVSILSEELDHIRRSSEVTSTSV